MTMVSVFMNVLDFILCMYNDAPWKHVDKWTAGQWCHFVDSRGKEGEGRERKRREEREGRERG